MFLGWFVTMNLIFMCIYQYNFLWYIEDTTFFSPACLAFLGGELVLGVGEHNNKPVKHSGWSLYILALVVNL